MDDFERRSAFVLFFVRIMQPFCRLADDPSADPRRNARAFRFGRAHEHAEVGALDELHREQLSLVTTVEKSVDLDDVRMIETRCQLRLFDEHRTEPPRGAVRW